MGVTVGVGVAEAAGTEAEAAGTEAGSVVVVVVGSVVAVGVVAAGSVVAVGSGVVLVMSVPP